MNLSFSPPAPGGDDDYPFPDDFKWYGNIQYLLNISSIGAICCVVLFLLVKLRSDHRPIPGPSALGTKLLAVWHAAGREIARHCGADAAQYLIVEGGSFAILLGTALIAVLLVLPVNIYAGTTVMDDQFSKTTITHIAKGAPVLWVHFVFVVLVVLLVHYGICEIEKRLKVTRFGDGLGNLSDTFENSSAVFTVMVKGIPRTLAANKGPFEKYFRERYPGKVHKVIVPMDLCALDEMAEELVKVRDEISKLVGKIDARLMYDENGVDEREESSRERSFNVCNGFLNKIKKAWADVCVKLGITDEESLRRLQELRAELEMEVAAYAAGRAPGAGVAFVVFKDVYTAIKTVKDFRSENKGSIGRLFPLTNLQLERNRWKVRQAPLATDIYWNHVGAAKLTVTLRKVLVNTSLLLLLLFFSSPLAVISALQRAGRIIDAEAMDNAHSWLVWVESSSWIVALVFQFLPNVLVFVSMYILIPSALSYLSKFEQHLTVSGEQRAALLKMFCFFLVNLILLRGLVESSLESAILSMGRCYLDREDCKRIEQYMSASFLSKSSLSTLAFLISCTFLGISYDLLAPIPWIKRKLQKLKKNDMLQLVPEHSDDDPFENQEIETTLHRPLISEDTFDGRANEVPNAIDYQGHALSVYPHSLSRTSPVPKQTFDFAQYYAFNLTIFALTMIYASFSPLVLPVGAVYFGYRYIVDKYNFLFVYRVRGFPAGNDGRLIDTVLSIMRFCVDLFLISMLLFFSVHGDSTKLLAIFTLAMFLIYKLLPPISDCLQPDMVQGIRTIEDVVEGPIDYEVFSQPRFEWDAPQY